MKQKILEAQRSCLGHWNTAAVNSYVDDLAGACVFVMVAVCRPGIHQYRLRSKSLDP